MHELTGHRRAVANHLRNGKWWTLAKIEEEVGFDPLPCLLDETRGARNFERRGDKWRMKAKAIELLVWSETSPRKPPTWGKPKMRPVKQGELF